MLLAHETGTGKSLTSIEWSKLNGDNSLFIVPKALKEKWERDLKKECSKGVVITKENFRMNWKSLSPYKNVIVDEAHYFSGISSQMSKSLYGYIKENHPRILLLTATPYMSTPWNIYTLARHLGHNWHYLDFKQRFFVDRYIGRRVVPEVRKGIEGEIAALVAKIGDVVRLDECVDVPQQVFETEYYKLTKQQEDAKKNIVEINPVVRYTRYHEIENGVLITDGYSGNSFFETDKLERIKELCIENKKVAVVCRYNLQIDLVRNALEKDVKKKVYVIQGITKGKDAIVQEIEKSDEAIVLINASCSEGYELPSVGVIVFASLSFSYKDYKQMCGRFLRINKLKKNAYIHLVSEGIDTEVYKSIMNKQDFDIAIYTKNYGNSIS